uniref:Calcineurin-like phosphoesterase domain-containing protein n=1 Tax=viral metagenome TaxID=1070528 RepID=A0A6C0EDC3_9ZZZZ
MSIIYRDLKFPLNVLSDIHLEYLPKISTFKELLENKNIKMPEDTNDKTLILAGDIGKPNSTQYWNFIDSCSDLYNDVIVVTGNHEYYADSCVKMDSINDIIRETRKKYANVHFLLNESVTFNNIHVVGGTLWTNIPTEVKDEIRIVMNDYRYINNNKATLLTPDDVIELHKESLEFIKNEIAKNKETLIVTHHLPSIKLIHEQYKSAWHNVAFYTNLESTIMPNVKYWICGHTHKKMKEMLTDTCLGIVNPVGYKGENKEIVIEEVYTNYIEPKKEIIKEVKEEYEFY